VVKNLLEHGWFKKTNYPCVSFQIPNNAWSIERWRNSLILCIHSNVRYSSSVLFQRGLHDLCLNSNFPNSNFSFHSSWDYSLAIAGKCKGCNSMVMSIINHIKQFSWLGQECSYFAIIPTRYDTLSIIHKTNTETLKSGNLNSQKLLTSSSVPDSDVIFRASSKDRWVIVRESNIIDFLIVTCVS